MHAQKAHIPRIIITVKSFNHIHQFSHFSALNAATLAMEGKLVCSSSLLLALAILQIPVNSISLIPDCLNTTGFNLWCPDRRELQCLSPNATTDAYDLVCNGFSDCVFSEADESFTLNPYLVCKWIKCSVCMPQYSLLITAVLEVIILSQVSCTKYNFG